MSTGRTCQPCTACCDGWVRIQVGDIDAYPGHPCHHSTGAGCDDYEHRPYEPCFTFLCAYVAPKSPLPDWMQPEKCGAIVILNKQVWRGLPVDLAVPVGAKIPEKTLNWLKQFAEEQSRPLIYTEQIIEAGVFLKQQEVLGYGPPAFQHDLRAWKKAGKSLW